MIKRYYSMFNCNQNYNSYKNIKYQLWLQRLDIKTNNISISICLGFQNFSENSFWVSKFQRKQFIGLCKTQAWDLTQLSRFHIWNWFYERLSPCPHDSHKIKKYLLYKPKDRYLMKISYTSLKRDLNFNKDII